MEQTFFKYSKCQMNGCQNQLQVAATSQQVGTTWHQVTDRRTPCSIRFDASDLQTAKRLLLTSIIDESMSFVALALVKSTN